MKPAAHVIISFSAGVVFMIMTRSFLNGCLCFFSGVILDIDHIIEFIFKFSLKKFSIRNVYESCRHIDEGRGEYFHRKLYLFFHSGEFAVFLLITAVIMGNKALLAVAVGYSLHVFVDAAANSLYPESYFLAVRILRRFEVDKMYKKRPCG